MPVDECIPAQVQQVVIVIGRKDPCMLTHDVRIIDANLIARIAPNTAGQSTECETSPRLRTMLHMQHSRCGRGFPFLRLLISQAKIFEEDVRASKHEYSCKQTNNPGEPKCSRFCWRSERQ